MDGNQTRIKTSTGIWNVCYDANDRPVSFTSEDGRTVVACGYDYQGRRFEKKVLTNGTAVSHTYYLYRGYLQVAELNLMHPRPVLEKSYLWDPTQTHSHAHPDDDMLERERDGSKREPLLHA